MSVSSPDSFVRRTKHKRTGRPLSAYALDITIRVNGDGVYFLDDLNDPGPPHPYADLARMLESLQTAIVESDRQHFR